MNPPNVKTILVIFLLGVLALAAAYLPRWLLTRRYQPSIVSHLEAPSRPIAIVFGAGLRSDGTPTRVLEDRVRTAASLYHGGKVTTLILSGSQSGATYDEPGAMLVLALQLGVPHKDILLDRGGSRTFQTCQRAKSDFGAKRVLLVSQEFHLPRALAICEALGIEALGVRADLGIYGRASSSLWRLREIPASFLAVWEVLRSRAGASFN